MCFNHTVGIIKCLKLLMKTTRLLQFQFLVCKPSMWTTATFINIFYCILCMEQCVLMFHMITFYVYVYHTEHQYALYCHVYQRWLW
jgi:hypothetical protein